MAQIVITVPDDIDLGWLAKNVEELVCAKVKERVQQRQRARREKYEYDGELEWADGKLEGLLFVVRIVARNNNQL